MPSLSVNDRVKQSTYALRPKRDYWLNQGDPRRKAQAKEWLDRAADERGTITEILAGDEDRGSLPGYRIAWDNGSESRCLPYMVDLAEEPKL
jgi:hypothetical protein